MYIRSKLIYTFSHFPAQLSLIIALILMCIIESAFSFQSTTVESPVKALKLSNLRIEVYDVFDPSESFYKYRIARWANLLHINTRRTVVKRELLFLPDSMITLVRIMESANNLRELGIFQWVHFNVDTLNGAYGDMTVTVKDHFSTELSASFSVEGGKIRTGFGFNEINLAGRGYKLGINMSNRGERSFLQGAFLNHRFLGSRFAQKIVYTKFEEGKLQFIGMNKFFYSREISWDMGTYYLNSTQKLFTYLTSDEYFKSDRSAKRSELFYGRYFGGRTRFRIGVKYLFHNEYLTDPNFHERTIEWKFRKVSFSFGGIKRTISVKQNIDRSDIEEDVHTGFLFNTGLGFDIQELGANARRIVYSLRGLYARSLTLNNNIYIEATHGGWLQKKHIVDRITNARFTLFSTAFMNHTLAAQIELNQLDSQRSSAQVFLGEDTGLRGYSIRNFIGTRRLVINLEDRIFSPVKLWFVRLGGTLFLDTGKVWGEGTDFKKAEWHTGIGLGVRLGIPKLTSGIVRIDITHNMDRRRFMSVSISNGSYFKVLYPIEIVAQNFNRLITN